MKHLLGILIILISVTSFGQIKPDKQRHNFGELYKDSQSYVDINFTNTSEKPQFLLTVEKPRDVYYIYSSKKVMPDSTMTIRFKVNNKIKGRFTYNIDVYFSNPRAAIPIQLNGNVKQAEMSSSLTACPDFNSTPSSYISTSFDVTVKVIDSLTREPLKNSKVYFVENGELVGTATTNSNGTVRRKIPTGYYYITAQRPPYNSNHHEGYLNFKRNYVEIELEKPYEEVPPPVVPDEIVQDDPPQNPNPPVKIEDKEEDEDENMIVIDPNVTNEDEQEDEEVEVIDPPVNAQDNPVVETPQVDPIPFAELPDTCLLYTSPSPRD